MFDSILAGPTLGAFGFILAFVSEKPWAIALCSIGFAGTIFLAVAAL